MVTDDGVRLAVEYNVVCWGDRVLQPQAGICVFERGADGLLAAVRIYDDVEPPTGTGLTSRRFADTQLTWRGWVTMATEAADSPGKGAIVVDMKLEVLVLPVPMWTGRRPFTRRWAGGRTPISATGRVSGWCS